jgi:hypothetical protein
VAKLAASFTDPNFPGSGFNRQFFFRCILLDHVLARALPSLKTRATRFNFAEKYRHARNVILEILEHSPRIEPHEERVTS